MKWKQYLIWAFTLRIYLHITNVWMWNIRSICLFNKHSTLKSYALCTFISNEWKFQLVQCFHSILFTGFSLFLLITFYFQTVDAMCVLYKFLEKFYCLNLNYKQFSEVNKIGCVWNQTIFFDTFVVVMEHNKMVCRWDRVPQRSLSYLNSVVNSECLLCCNPCFSSAKKKW